MEPEIRIGDGVAVAELGNLLVVLWEAEAKDERWDWQVAAFERFAAKVPEGFFVLNIILSTATPPSASLRRRMQAYMRSFAPSLRKIVVVAVGDSLWLSVVRTIIRGLALIGGIADRQQVVASLSEGIAASRELGALVSATEVVQAVGQMAKGLKLSPIATRALSI